MSQSILTREFHKLKKFGIVMECPISHTQTSQFNTDFCLHLGSHLMLEEADKGSNFVFSPLSFHTMLSLTATGSSGRTLNQLLFNLRSNSIEDVNLSSSRIVSLIASSERMRSQDLIGGPLVSFVNGAWIRQGLSFKPSFEEIVKGVFEAVAKEVDFVNKADQIIDEVNSWAENETEGLIKSLLPPRSLDSSTVLVLANALYFKGAWNQRFDASKTESRDFNLLNGQTVRVPFMTCEPYERQLYGSFEGFKVLKIPYQNCHQDTRQFSMYFFLPDKRHGLRNLIEKFISNPIFFNKSFELQEEFVSNFWIPKFKFSFEFEATEIMTKLGLGLLFTAYELTEIVDSPSKMGLNISEMFHKSFIEVNEEGTEAAACTAVVMLQRCSYPIPSFVADHPFMFMIKEDISGLVFFTGAVLNPLLDS